MKYKISKKGLILAISALLILVSISSFTSGIEETNNEIGTYNNPTSSPTDKGTHIVLAEESSATWCPHCPPVIGYMNTIYTSGQYEFYYLTLVCDMSTYANTRRIELGVTGYPTVTFDGGYTSVVGNVGSTGPYINAINTCGSRTVADVDLDISVTWLGDAEMEINVDVTNNEASTYNGHLHVYVTENLSRWICQGTTNYHFGWIGDYAFNQDINVGAGNTWSDTVTWDGDTYGFGDITMDNIAVIASVFDQSTDLTDETTAAAPKLQDIEPPVISNVQANPSIQTAGGYVNISADVTDNTEVNEVKVNITYPDMSTISETMIEDGGGTYCYNTSYATSGTYDFNIWANDLENNQAESPHDTFVIVNPHITNLSQGWNFVSLPFNQSIDLVDLTVNYGGTDYTWTAATGIPIVDPNVYGWDRILDMYVPATTMEPGYGYWIYAYFDCELLGQDISVIPDNYITDLKMGWNAMGVPSDQSVDLVDLTVNYGGTDYTWTAATGIPIVDPNVYGWDRILDMYVPVTTMGPGYAYWIYAYQDCWLFL